MSLSAQQITSKLPFLHSLIAAWEAKNVLSSTGQFPPLENLTIGDQRDGKDVVVAFRTRPPLDFEFERFQNERSEDDSEGTEDGGKHQDSQSLKDSFRSGIAVTSSQPGIMVAHVPGMKWNGPTLAHKSFNADLAFGPTVSNEEVYQRTVVAHDMINLALGGGVGCIIAYGQTGAGKTYTMSSLEQLISRELFPAAELFAKRFSDANEHEIRTAADVFQFEVTFLELLGKNARDLVGTDLGKEGDESENSGEKQHKSVEIIEDKAGFVRPLLTSTEVHSATELSELIVASLSHRRTSTTARNTTSSRSHAVLCIRIKNKILPHLDEGELILVDLAGSERYDDSKAHSKELMEQSKENNKSLSNLKECVRSRAKAGTEEGVVHIPFRANKLTLLLKNIFDLESTRLSKTVVIAHVSPHLQDTAHSVNTLSYASPFLVAPPKNRGPPPFDKIDPRTWTHEYTIQWLTSQLTAIALKKAAAEYGVRAKQAALNNKKLKPYEPPENIRLAIDPLTFCPEPFTGKHLARIYMAEWLEKFMKAAVDEGEKEGSKGISKIKMDAVKDAGLVIYGTFTHMLLVARTRTRNQVLKSRKKLTEDNLYGEAPWREKSTQEIQEGWDVTPSQWHIFERHRGPALQEVVQKAADEAKEKGEDEGKAKARAAKQMWDDWFGEIQMKHSKELRKRLLKAYQKAKDEGLDHREAIQNELARLMGFWLSDKEVPPEDE